jgi:ATP-binding protein involved in chromosome partitioning
VPNGSNQLENSLYELARGVIDPELGSNIVELGMLRSIEVGESGKVVAEVALTVASCPLRKQIEGDLKNRLERHPGVESVEVRVVAVGAAGRGGQWGGGATENKI